MSFPIWKAGESGKTMVWNGHFDVVPPGEDWEVDPFGGEVKDGFVYGRGSSDMKSGVTAMIVALGALKKAGSPLRVASSFRRSAMKRPVATRVLFV